MVPNGSTRTHGQVCREVITLLSPWNEGQTYSGNKGRIANQRAGSFSKANRRNSFRCPSFRGESRGVVRPTCQDPTVVQLEARGVFRDTSSDLIWRRTALAFKPAAARSYEVLAGALGECHERPESLHDLLVLCLSIDGPVRSGFLKKFLILFSFGTL